MKYFKQTTRDNQINYIERDNIPKPSPSGYFVIEEITKSVYDKNKYVQPQEEIERQEQAQIQSDLINSDMRMIRKIEDYLKTKQDLPEILTEEISVRETLRTKIKK